MQWAGALRRDLSTRNQQIAITSGSVHELTAGEMPSVIFGRSESRQHGNFHSASYRNICANPAWARRLTKVRTASGKALPTAGWRWMELDCANSSDALLKRALVNYNDGARIQLANKKQREWPCPSFPTFREMGLTTADSVVIE